MDLLHHFQLTGFDTIQTLFAFELGSNLYEDFNEQASESLQFFRDAFAPKEYSKISLLSAEDRARYADALPDMDDQMPFVRPLGTFTEKGPGDLPEQQHGMEQIGRAHV